MHLPATLSGTCASVGRLSVVSRAANKDKRGTWSVIQSLHGLAAKSKPQLPGTPASDVTPSLATKPPLPGKRATPRRSQIRVGSRHHRSRCKFRHLAIRKSHPSPPKASPSGRTPLAHTTLGVLPLPSSLPSGLLPCPRVILGLFHGARFGVEARICTCPFVVTNSAPDMPSTRRPPTRRLIRDWRFVDLPALASRRSWGARSLLRTQCGSLCRSPYCIAVKRFV